MPESRQGLRDGWSESETLLALRQVTDTASRVPAVVARQARLSHSELRALDHLSRGPLGPGELARLLEVTTAAATGVVDRLVTHGHAARVARDDDRRRTDVRLTDAGRAEVVRWLLPMFAALQELDGSFDADERAVVARYLRGAAHAFEAVAGPAPARQASSAASEA